MRIERQVAIVMPIVVHQYSLSKDPQVTTTNRPISQETLDRARALGTSTLYEAAQLPSIDVDCAIRSIWAGAVVAGEAFPVHCAPADNLALHVALELAPSGSVLVAATSDVVTGFWGEVMTTAAQIRGIAGLVIDGEVRDIAAIRERKFPVFARGICMRGPAKGAVVSVGESISLRDTQVARGDLVVGDDDGVVVIPRAAVEKVMAAAEARAAKEARIMEQLAEGQTTLELFGLSQWRR